MKTFSVKDVIFGIASIAFCGLAIAGAVLEACGVSSLGVCIALAVAGVALVVLEATEMHAKRKATKVAEDVKVEEMPAGYEKLEYISAEASKTTTKKTATKKTTTTKKTTNK